MLVVQASLMGDGGEIFILRMGEPIRIAELARDLIALHGLRPGTDVRIEYTGLRPGEKLQVISFDDRIELIPVRPMSEMKGFLKGLDPTFKRDKEDRV